MWSGRPDLSRQRDVESYFSVLQAYYDVCQSVVARHGGLIAQHHGDGIYIWFGYPRPAEDDAVRAVRAGLDLLVVLKPRVDRAGGRAAASRWQVRIAAHAGEVLVASVENESGPLAFGHTPNLAAKLQQSARPGTVVISSALLRLVEARLRRDATPRTPSCPTERLRCRRTRSSAPARAGRPDRPGRWRTPLVGRPARARARWNGPGRGAERCRGGRSRSSVTVGSGKTRLASAFVDRGAATGQGRPCSTAPAAGSTRARLPDHARRCWPRRRASSRDDPPIVSAARLQRARRSDRLGMD